jgi:thymidylate synthase (FAD)
MKVVEPGFEIIEQEDSSGTDGILKHIERVGRVCYKSEDRITDNSYVKFVNMLEEKKHGAMLEHGTVYLEGVEGLNFDFEKNHYSVYNKPRNSFVTTNWRVIVENGLKDRVEHFISKMSSYHERRVTVKFTCDRGVSHEFVRNRGKRGNAFAQESTRYCNYGKNGGVAYCFPVWIKEEGDRKEFENFCGENERQYLDRIRSGWEPQQARGYLNHFLKTELVITAFTSDWNHFFSLRADSRAHPSARQLAEPLKEEFQKRRWIA